MKKVLLFSLLLFLIPTMIITYYFSLKEEEFIFTSNTMVRIKRSKTGKIEKIPLEEYIMGVVAGEMPVSFQEEALKAQAVASRSYVMYQIKKNKKKDYDVIDTVLNQVYLDDETLKKKWSKNYDKYIKKIKKSVEDTAYQYVTYKGKIAETLFFSTSSGYTENSEDVFTTKLPYLRSVESKWDKISPSFQKVTNLSKNDFLKILKLKSSDKIKVTILSKTKGGRVNKIKINEKTYTGKEIVSLLGLKSLSFTITQNENKVVITTKGYGHGVGMSQYGAEGMAKEGYTYEEILKHYYTGIELKKIKK